MTRYTVSRTVLQFENSLPAIHFFFRFLRRLMDGCSEIPTMIPTMHFLPAHCAFPVVKKVEKTFALVGVITIIIFFSVEQGSSAKREVEIISNRAV